MVVQYNHNHRTIHTALAQQCNYIAAAIISNTPTGINKTTSIVKGYHDRSIPITGGYDDELNTEVTSIMCYENSRMTTFYNCEGSTN